MLLFPEIGQAQTLTWTGGGGNANWSNANNWNPATALDPWTEYDYIMSGSTNLSPSTGAQFYFANSMKFAADAGAFTISGAEAFVVTSGGIRNDSTNLQTLQQQVIVSAAQTWNAASGDLVFTLAVLQNDLTIDGAHDTTINYIQNNGSPTSNLVKQGSGTLLLLDGELYSAPTTVTAGTLSVQGTISGSFATVGENGTLLGIGSVEDLTNYGTVAPGNSIGTLQIGGNYTSQAGSTLQIEINDGGTTPGINNDLLVVWGDTTINGGTVQVLPESGTYAFGAKYRFLFSDSQITGEFDSISVDLPGFSAQLGYNEYFDDFYWVYFILQGSSPDYLSFAQTKNQFAIAGYLDDVAGGASGDLSTVLDGLNTLESDPAAMRAAFDSMTGQVSPTMAAIGLQNTTLMTQQLAQQLRSGSFGGGNISLASGSSFLGPSQAAKSLIALVGYSKRSGAPQVVFAADESYDDAWKGWGLGYGLGGNASSDGNAAGLNYGMGGTMLGAERWFDRAGRVGFFGGYQGTSLRLNGLAQSGTINGGQFGGYLYNDDGFNYYTMIGGTQFNDFGTRRFVQFDGIDRVASGEFSGWQGYGYLERGVSFRTERTTLQPYAALQYIYLRQNSYTETGADSLNLSVAGLDANSLRSLIGGRMQFEHGTTMGHRLLPELRALWLHEFLNTDAVVNSFFAPIGGGSFAVQGLNLGRDWAILGGGLRWKLDGGWDLYANYDAQVNTQQVFHVGSGGAQYAW